VFLSWDQVIEHSASREYGIEVPWVSLLLTFLAAGSLLAAAALAAHWRYYGVSIAVGAFIVSMLGSISLFVLAGIGL
jgi:type IV secretory pathway VirB6-like protein